MELMKCRRSFHSDRDLCVVFQRKWLPSRFSVDGVDGAIERKINLYYDDIHCGRSVYRSTKSNRGRVEEQQESCRSPGGVVARLMGLDSLPAWFEPITPEPEAWLEKELEYVLDSEKMLKAWRSADMAKEKKKKKKRQTEERRMMVLEPLSRSEKNIEKSNPRSSIFAKEIAKQIVKQVQEDVWKKSSTVSRINSRKSLREASCNTTTANTASKRVASHSYGGWSLPNSPRLFNRQHESLTLKKNEESHQILHRRPSAAVGNRIGNDSVSNHPNSSLRKKNSLRIEPLSSRSERFSNSITPPSLLRSLSVPANAQFTVNGQQGQRSGKITPPAVTKTTLAGSIFNRKIFLRLKNTLSLPRKKGTENQKPKLYTSQTEIPEIIVAKKSIPQRMSPKDSSRKSNNTSANPSLTTAKTTGFNTAASLVSLTNFSRFFKRLHNFRYSDDLSRNPISQCHRGDATSVDSHTSKSNNDLEKHEQPSPVSVLLSELFLEDSPSPSKPFGHNYDNSKICNSRYKGKAHNGDEIFLSILSIPSTSESTKEHRTNSWYGANEALQSLDSFMFDEFSFPINRTSEMAYLRDILVFSGLSKSNSVELCCFSCHHGLDPSLFEKMEEFYEEMRMKKEETLWRPEGSSYRRLLFDMVDEYFLNGAAKPGEDHGYPWMNKCHYSYLFTGQRLLGNLWSHLSSALDSATSDQEREEDIDSDLLKIDTTWASTENELSRVLLDIEKLIFKGLIEELLILRTL